MRKIRCAIYTRKSSEEGLEQEFNSLDAQREACEAYIASQKHEGWVLLSEHYDDGGISGGTLIRPALQRLMAHIDDGDVDQIVVYKIDRLTRSLPDFAKLVDRLDAKEASFVSVTQSFNTATSMGRLTLNVLLSFAQFEREVTAERIRDKIAASKKKGLWMGGYVPLGYDANGRTLKINQNEAETIRTLYDLYLKHRLIRLVKEDAIRLGLRSKRRISLKGMISGDRLFDRGQIHHMLSNPIYAGRIRHKGAVYEGLHTAIIDPDVWGRVQMLLKKKAPYIRGRQIQAIQPSLLIGKLFDEAGDRLTPSHSKKNGKRLRYYISYRLSKQSGEKDISGWRLPAKPLEDQITQAVLNHIRQNVTSELLIDPDATTINNAVTAINELQSRQDETVTLINRVNIAPGRVEINLDAHQVSALFNLKESSINTEALTFKLPFQTRKRGVETKLIIGHVEPEKDHTLIRNLATAHKWLGMIKSGKSLDDVAKQNNTSRRRIQQIIAFAFLAPDIVQAILDGRQPIGLTSEWILRRKLPNDWQDQRALIATL
jgi:DNA invertase Pin-like site-specific DNA recombinase